MRYFRTIISLVSICFFLQNFSLEACTRIFWNENSKAKIVARTMDLFISDEPQMHITPRGSLRKSEVENGLNWVIRYGSLSISAFQLPNVITDGMNEHGFAIHALALGTTKYEKRDDRPGVHYGEWGQFLLDTCATVQEAIEAHEHFQVVPFVINKFVWPLHLMLEDASGDSAIIEFVGGQRYVYHSREYRVGTNDPTYDLQLKNLTNFTSFGGAYPLPVGKTDSISRFVLASAALQELPEPENYHEAMVSIKEAIAPLCQKEQVFHSSQPTFADKELKTSTLWTSIMDLTNLIYYFYPIYAKDGLCLYLQEFDFQNASCGGVFNFFDPTAFEDD